ncbi:sensor histidine kinase [Rhizobium sp. RU36D]|uniref:sensor histidine kinase n=1 Tax=Rhizobium sp. RU36D TaxID=1907415 RepID=UPI0009D83B75|nr:sensor histidine kinase [Rhizobium sp. RU36D]SMC96683.1 Two-component sensor histidine kinase, contains HisKA and HATPase domains [Rhizobium sp. RU36D]
MRFLSMVKSWLRGAAGVRAYMVGLALITTLPLAIFSVLIVGELREGQIEDLRHRASQEAESLARTVERQFHDMTTTLMVIETAPELQFENYEQFHDRANAALARSGWYLLVVDRNGQQLVNTRVPFGQVLGKTSNMDALRRAIETGDIVVSNVFFGRTSQAFVYNVMKTIKVPGRTEGERTLIMTQSASDVKRLLGERPLPPRWNYALIDDRNVVVASSTDLAAGDAFPADRLDRAKAVYAQAELPDETDEMLGYATIGMSHWQVVVWGPAGTAMGSLGTIWRNLILAAIGFFVLSMICAVIFGWRLQAGIKGIAGRAAGVGRGEIVSPLNTGIRELDQVSRALSEASFDRHQAEERLQVVLREMAHRTKNVILVAQSLVRQTARHSGDKAAFASAINGRLGSFARSLELLMSDRTSAPMMRELVSVQLATFVETENRLVIDGEDFPVAADAVKEVGMVLHELATNAMKYGALSTPEGRLHLEWHGVQHEDRPMLRLVWRETGGPPPATRTTEPGARSPGEKATGEKGFGSVLIDATIGSLQGSARCDYQPEGVVWTIEIPQAMIRAAE